MVGFPAEVPRVLWSASAPGRFTPEERTFGIHHIGESVGPRAGMNTLENRIILLLPGIDPRFLRRPALSLVTIQTTLRRTQYKINK